MSPRNRERLVTVLWSLFIASAFALAAYNDWQDEKRDVEAYKATSRVGR